MFEITEPTTAELTSVTNRVEKHGDKDVPAISLGLMITAANTILDKLPGGTLRRTLYTKPDGQDGLPGIDESTPLLRTRGIDHLALAGALEGWHLIIDHGIDGDSAIECGSCKVDKFRVVPKEGGTVELSFRVGTADVGIEDAGLLWSKNGQQVSVTLTAPEKKPEAAIDGSPRDDPARADGGLFDDDEAMPAEKDATQLFVEQSVAAKPA